MAYPYHDRVLYEILLLSVLFPAGTQIHTGTLNSSFLTQSKQTKQFPGCIGFLVFCFVLFFTVLELELRASHLLGWALNHLSHTSSPKGIFLIVTSLHRVALNKY
jgi:hypothetical protein